MRSPHHILYTVGSAALWTFIAGATAIALITPRKRLRMPATVSAIGAGAARAAYILQTRTVIDYQNYPAEYFWNRRVNIALLILEPSGFK